MSTFRNQVSFLTSINWVCVISISTKSNSSIPVFIGLISQNKYLSGFQFNELLRKILLMHLRHFIHPHFTKIILSLHITEQKCTNKKIIGSRGLVFSLLSLPVPIYLWKQLKFFSVKHSMLKSSADQKTTELQLSLQIIVTLFFKCREYWQNVKL